MRSTKSLLIFLLMIALVVLAVGTPNRASPQTGVKQTPPEIPGPLTAQERAIKVTVATVASFFGPATNHYKVGDQIPITITMTNTSAADVSVCISSDLYQDLPTLTRNGKAVAYMNWQSYERPNARRNHVCQNENLPEPVILKPNQPQLLDWFVLADGTTSSGSDAWYDPLPPGKYELTIRRRLTCCVGPMVESNTISFEVGQ